MTRLKAVNSDERMIIHAREFNAPRNLVFNAWTDPVKIGKWWGPTGFTTSTKQMEFSTGGEWIFTMHGPDGTDYPNHIVYTGIKEPEKIQYDHYKWKNSIKDSPLFKSTVTFEDLGGKCRVQMQLLFPTVEKRSEAVEFGAIEGGKQTLNRLAEFLNQL